MTPVEVLEHEHQVIGLALRGAEREARLLQEGGAAHGELLEQIVDLAREFVDACHHGKEEKLVFPKLAERGVPGDSGLIAELLAEHVEGRQRVRAIAAAIPRLAAGEEAVLRAAGATLSEYVTELRQHIRKETGQLFPLMRQVLSEEDQADLAAAFERLEVEETGAGVHERYAELAHRLAEPLRS